MNIIVSPMIILSKICHNIPIFNRQWNSLKSEMKLEDRPLRRQLEHFIDRKHDLFVFVQYVKALTALGLSFDFHRRFHKRNRDVAASIHYWTILCVTGIHMRMDRLHNLPACAETFRFKLLPKIDLLRSCYIAYLTDQREKIWKPDSRISRFIRCKWNAPDLEASCLDRIATKSDAGRYANILVVILSEILHALGELRNTPGPRNGSAGIQPGDRKALSITGSACSLRRKRICTVPEWPPCMPS